MRSAQVLRQRLHNQRLAGAPFEPPEDMVRWLGAVQSQDYAGARWSVGQRTRACTDVDVARAFDEGRILRTHVLRPTWHFVTPADIRWMLMLTEPRVSALNATYYRKLELDDALFARSHAVFARALSGGRHRTRSELALLLEEEGILADKLRLSYIMMHAELDGLICSGAVRGKQQTYALLADRAPDATILERDDALAELTRRFFVGHGPATPKDFVRWSGLRLVDARHGLEMIGHGLVQEKVSGNTYWCDPAMPTAKPASGRTAYLLPEYDECLIAYESLGFPDLPVANGKQSWSDFFYRPIIIGDKRAGTWRRTIAKGSIVLEANLFATLDEAGTRALGTAAKRYGRFMNLPVAVVGYP